MGNMDGWDVALLAAAAYIAVTALVRLMIRRRNQLLGEFRKRMKTEKKDDHPERASPQPTGQEPKAA